jgi:acetyltransferase
MDPDAQVLLLNGSKIIIRPIAADDAPRLQAFVRRLSVRSRRFRFFTGIVELSQPQLEQLVNLDQRRGLALVAVSEQSKDSAIVAEARYVLEHADRGAEFAVVVADDFQRRGLGRRLIQRLIAYAARTGVRRLFGEILADNHAMLALARRLGFQIRSNVLDHTTVTASIAPSAR